MKTPLSTMEKLIWIFLYFVVINSFSQERIEQVNDTINKTSKTNDDVEAFQPDVKLLNKSIWNRVSANRFECEYLRLAVELRNNEYWLLEMDGDRRLLARHKQYSIISNVIVQLTLRSSPNIFDNMKLNKKESDYLNFLLLYHRMMRALSIIH